jgi:uncharacterized protein (DUF305 family)
MRIPSLITAAVVSAGFVFAAGLGMTDARSEELPPGCGSGAAPAAMAHDMGAMGGMSHEMMMSMQKMNAQMAIGMATKDPDLAFLCGMIPHHQGAIDMAQELLKTGKDPEAKVLAQGVIDAQVKEIATMRAMIERLTK